MNILMALSQLEVTGAEAYTTALADSLTALGHRVFIVSDTWTLPGSAVVIALPLAKRGFLQRLSNIRALVRLVKEHQIHVLHAHSRAAGWCAYFAARWCGVPLVTTVHGRQPTHFSRKLVKAFGDVVFPVCEAIRDNLVKELGVNPRTVEVVRNGVATPRVDETTSAKLHSNHNRPLVTLIGRLSKEKGDLAYRIVQELLPLLGDAAHLRVVGGDNNGVPAKFDTFRSRVDFTGFVSNVADYLAASDVVIGAGRSAIEAILLEKPTIAVGEARLHGLVTPKNFDDALRTNFGDIDTATAFDGALLRESVQAALQRVPKDANDANRTHTSTSSPDLRLLRERTKSEFDLERLVRRIDTAYQRSWAEKRRTELPILTYHRLVRSKTEGGSLPIWVTVAQMDEHLHILKEQGFTTLTMSDLAAMPTLAERFRPEWKPIVLTFDDGYEDNYTLLFPLLQRYGFTTTIFLVAARTHNLWDKGSGQEALPLLTTAQALEMQRYGIDFGSHSLTHPRLAEGSLAEAEKEIQQSKEILEERLGRGMTSFCYPYGSLNSDVKRLVGEAGYTFGVASDSGSAFLQEDLLEVRRIGVFPNTDASRFRRKISGGYIFRNRVVRQQLRH